MNRNALFLVLFGVIFLVIFTITFGRSKRWVVPTGEAPDITLARRKSNRLVVGIAVATVLGSWGAAAVIQLQGINIPHVSIEVIFTSILVICWMIMIVIPTLRLRELSRNLQLVGGTDEGLLKTIEAVKAMRLKMGLLFGIMAGISLMNLVSNLLSAPK